MNRYILAHDLGTSGNKASLFSERGEMIGSEVYPYDVQYFHGNWAEQNAEDWWKAVQATSRNLLKKTGVPAKEVAVVAFSGQMMGCLCVDKTGTPLRNAIIWADQRAGQQARKLGEAVDPWKFYKIVGHRNTASYGIQKLMWVKEHEPEIYDQTYKMLNAKDYIVFKLTGKFYTEYSDGNSCGCLDIVRRQWSEEILHAAGIEPEKLPELKESTYVAGGVTAEAAKLTGLQEGTPVVLGGGDGVTANVGTGSVSPGKTYCSMGTSAWITTTSEKPVFDEKMRIVNWVHIVPDYYAPNGTMQYAGGSYGWLKNTVCLMEQYDAKIHGKSPYDYMNEEAEKSPAGANGVIFLPYLLGERAPRWNSDAKGAFLGLKAENTRADLIRSVLEGVTMNLSLCLDILRTQMNIQEITAVGGGAKGSTWRNIMADIFGAKIFVPEVLEEASSMGAAITGGVGAGIYKNFNVVEDFLKIRECVEPNDKTSEFYRKRKEVFDGCYYALESIFKKI